MGKKPDKFRLEFSCYCQLQCGMRNRQEYMGVIVLFIRNCSQTVMNKFPQDF